MWTSKTAQWVRGLLCKPAWPDPQNPCKDGRRERWHDHTALWIPRICSGTYGHTHILYTHTQSEMIRAKAVEVSSFPAMGRVKAAFLTYLVQVWELLMLCKNFFIGKLPSAEQTSQFIPVSEFVFFILFLGQLLSRLRLCCSRLHRRGLLLFLFFLIVTVSSIFTQETN